MIRRTTAATQNTIIIATGDGGHFSQLFPSRMKQVARSYGAEAHPRESHTLQPAVAAVIFPDATSISRYPPPHVPLAHASGGSQGKK